MVEFNVLYVLYVVTCNVLYVLYVVTCNVLYVLYVMTCNVLYVIYVLYVHNSYILPRCAAADVKCFICCSTLYPDVVIVRQFILQICA